MDRNLHDYFLPLHEHLFSPSTMWVLETDPIIILRASAFTSGNTTSVCIAFALCITYSEICTRCWLSQPVVKEPADWTAEAAWLMVKLLLFHLASLLFCLISCIYTVVLGNDFIHSVERQLWIYAALNIQN